MSVVQDDAIKKQTQLAEITITKGIPTMADLLKGMATWLLESKPNTGKQSLKKLTESGDKLSSIPLNDESIKSFEKIAQKHDISFAIEKDDSKTPPVHTVYFKAKDTETMSAAFKEYISSEVDKGKSKASFKDMMDKAKSDVKSQVVDTDKNQQQEVAR